MEVSVQDLCAVGSWSSPLTFVHYYMLKVFALVMEQAVLKSNWEQSCPKVRYLVNINKENIRSMAKPKFSQYQE